MQYFCSLWRRGCQHLIFIIWWISNPIMQSTFASLECASQSELVCLKHTHIQTTAHTHSPLKSMQQTCQAYAYFPKPLSRSGWDLLQCLKWCCVCFYCFLKARHNDAVLHIKHLLRWTQTQRSAFTLTEPAHKHAQLLT